MGNLTLILGGARSGKSTYAERLAKNEPGMVLPLHALGHPLEEK